LNVLVVDDEPSICWGLEKVLSEEGFEVSSAGSAEKGLALAEQMTFDLVLLDVRLPGISGIESLQSFHRATGKAPIIVMSAFGDLETAVQVVKQGACDYLHKPFGLDEVLSSCRKAFRTQQVRRPGSQRPLPPSDSQGDSVRVPKSPQLVGRSAAMQRVFRQIALVADSDLSVLITGETGTGKELVAAAIHRHSLRSERPYVPLAPVALSPSLLESELFGHVRGSFTGATEDRAGLFETASGGTILLDEIGDLPLAVQVKLLRVLEQGQYCRVGEINSRPCNVRILSATHHDLRRGVTDGKFRQDLLFRLSAVELNLPPLRERIEDIEPLAIHFLELFGYPDPEAAISSHLIAHLQNYSWPGNVRELRNSLERAAVLARGRALDVTDFPFREPPRPGFSANSRAADDASERVIESVHQWARQTLSKSQNCSTLPADSAGLKGDESSSSESSSSESSSSESSSSESSSSESASKERVINPQAAVGNLYDEFLNLAEPALLRAALEAAGGNRSAASDILGMHRTTLRERLRKYQMDQ
jgi:two-component system, NtrC family, nitrogen regulation response regulator GlnG